MNTNETKTLNDAKLARLYSELSYRMIECAMDSNHPATKANRSRWTREYETAARECEKRGMFA